MAATLEDLRQRFASLERCCLHQPVWHPDNAETLLCAIENSSGQWQDCGTGEWNWKGGTESRSYAVVRLRDGRWGLFSESEDYTGHGCQCDAATNVYDSLDDLLRLGIEEWVNARDVIRARLA